MVRQAGIAAAVVALAFGSTACATKKFVRQSVGEVNDKVDSLGRSVEQTQERTRTNEARINDVDQRAQAAAQAANTNATAAGQAAAAANTAAGAANAVATNNTTRLDALDKNARRLVYEVVLNEDQGNFKPGQSALPDATKARIDQMVQQLKQDPKNVFIEIEGHTDNTGTPEVNEKVGMARAEAVKRYLYTQYQIPLHKISVFSYGQEKPVAPNTTREGRAQNRRVVIRVLS